MDIRLNLGEWSRVFSVPVSVVDKHLRSVNETYLKVLLVVLRQGGDQISDESIAEMLSVPKDTVMEAVHYWNNAGIFSNNSEGGLKISHITKLTSEPAYLSAKEISNLILTNPEVKFLFDKLELLYGRPVTSTEQKNYTYLYESAGLPADVLIMIAEYCLSIDHGSILYIKKVALNWAEEGINTHEKAVERILAMSKNNRTEQKVKSCFGIDNRSLSSKEKGYVKTWTEQYQYDIDMIELAYNRTIDRIGKLSFAYVDTILKSWYENQLRTAKEVEDKDMPAVPKKSKKQSGKQPSYDLEKFEQLGYDIPEIELEEKE